MATKANEGSTLPAEDSSELVNGIAGAVVAVATEAVLARTPLAKAASLAGATLGITVAYELGKSELWQDLVHAFDGGEPNALVPDCLPKPHPIADIFDTIGLPVLGSPMDNPIGTPVLAEFELEQATTRPFEQDTARIDYQTVLAMSVIDGMAHRGNIICDPQGTVDPDADIGGSNLDVPSGDLL